MGVVCHVCHVWCVVCGVMCCVASNFVAFCTHRPSEKLSMNT